MNAYRLSFEVRQLLDSIGEGGELTPETEAILDKLASNREQLVEYLGLAIREHNLAAVALRGESAWLSQGARRHEDAGVRLREYLLNTLKEMGVKTITTDTQKITISASPIKVQVEEGLDLTSVDEKFVAIKRSVNTDAVKVAAERGEELPPGIALVQGEHVKISPR